LTGAVVDVVVVVVCEVTGTVVVVVVVVVVVGEVDVVVVLVDVVADVDVVVAGTVELVDVVVVDVVVGEVDVVVVVVVSPTLPFRPTTFTGIVLTSQVRQPIPKNGALPSPSSPRSSLPQHLTAPVLVSAHTCSISALMATTPLLRPLTWTGVLELWNVSSPSRPCWLKPQHSTAPAMVSAQFTSRPALIAATPIARPLTSTGTALFVADSVPSSS